MIAGVIYDRLPHHNDEVCHDCNVTKGQLHHPICDMEECPICGGQFISCPCGERIYEHRIIEALELRSKLENMAGWIDRPPLESDSEVPTKDDLLRVQAGDHVKLLCCTAGHCDRHWFEVVDCTTRAADEWIGKAPDQRRSNKASSTPTCRFHPFDVTEIDVRPEKHKRAGV